jgi:hypothetical protein
MEILLFKTGNARCHVLDILCDGLMDSCIRTTASQYRSVCTHVAHKTQSVGLPTGSTVPADDVTSGERDVAKAADGWVVGRGQRILADDQNTAYD